MTEHTRMSETRPKPFRQRLRIIAQGIVEGKTYGEIAIECGVTERTIYRDRQTLEYEKLATLMLDNYLQELASLAKVGDKVDKRFVIRQRGFIVTAMLPRRVEKAIVEFKLVQPVFSKLLESTPKRLEAEYEEVADRDEDK